jgi:glycosyltransferase involved in cell wall biosynthesis
MPGRSKSADTLRSFAVVIPMYNEEDSAERAVREVMAALERHGRRSALITVDDGSRDGTAAVLSRLVPMFDRLICVRHDVNRGYGAALQTGAREAAVRSFDYALYMDSDLTNNPDDISTFVGHMDEDVDVIKATRYSGGGQMRGVSVQRVVVSAVGNRVARFLFRLPLHDCTNGFRAVRVPILQQMDLTERRFPVIMEELYWCKFLARTYAEVPVVLTNRDAAVRPSSFTYSPSVFWRYLRYPLLAFLGVRPAGLRRRPYTR